MKDELGIIIGDTVIFNDKVISFPMFETILEIYDWKKDEEFKELVFTKCTIHVDKSIYLGYGVPKRTFIDCKFIISKECTYIDGSMKMYGGQGITMIRTELFLSDDSERFSLETMCVNNIIINKTFNNKELSFNKVNGTFSFENHDIKFKSISLLDSNLSQDEISGQGVKTEELHLNESSLVTRRSFICDKIVLHIKGDYEASCFFKNNGEAIAGISTDDISGNLTTRYLINKTITDDNEWMNDLEDSYIIENIEID